jgi:hypothetical protein
MKVVNERLVIKWLASWWMGGQQGLQSQ